MKRLNITLLILAIAVPALAQTTQSRPRSPRTETIIVRDGKVFRNGELLDTFAGKRGFLGVNVMDLTDELRSHYGAPKDAGVLVSRIEENGPADKAGVRVGDIIVAIDGKDVDSSADVRASVRDKKDGESARIDVLRGKSRQTLVASVDERETAQMFSAIPFENFRVHGTNLEGIREMVNTPEWRARIESSLNCDELQTKLREIETRMKELEKKLQK
jgi:membrane-associated protease RseP (regulator of RpoE activity)